MPLWSRSRFTGEATAAFQDQPWKLRLKEAYTEGKRDGDTREFFRNGMTKPVQRCRMGEPEYAAIYHKKGKLKMEIRVEAEGGHPGLYQRWYADGTPECRSGVDEAQHWHGDYQEWTAAGVLKTHYRFKNGDLRVVLLGAFSLSMIEFRRSSIEDIGGASIFQKNAARGR